MRWFLGIIGLIGALVAIALGVGFFLIPARLEIVRSADIARPPATVFALVDSMRSFADISPWAEFDPNGGFAVTGPWRGPGQAMRWTSTHPAVLSGGLDLTAATPASAAALTVTMGDLPKAALDLKFEPAGPGTRLTWTWRQTCPAGFDGLACRYRLATLRKDLQNLAELGLMRWARRAGELPVVDFSGLQVAEAKPAAAADFAYNETETSLDPMQMQAGEKAALEIVRGFLAANGMTAVGQPIVVVTQWDEQANKYGFRAGYRFQGPAPTTALQVRLGKSPVGPALTTSYRGPWTGLAQTFRQFDAFVTAYGVRPSGAPWQMYAAGGPLDPTAAVDVELFLPIHAPAAEPAP
jgi:hypothetical protein